MPRRTARPAAAGQGLCFGGEPLSCRDQGSARRRLGSVGRPIVRDIVVSRRKQMNETEARTGFSSGSPARTKSYDDEEPPSRPRRHPLWRDVPDSKWDDWRWQSQHAIRTTAQLRELLPFSPDELDALA